MAVGGGWCIHDAYSGQWLMLMVLPAKSRSSFLISTTISSRQIIDELPPRAGGGRVALLVDDDLRYFDDIVDYLR